MVTYQRCYTMWNTRHAHVLGQSWLQITHIISQLSLIRASSGESDAGACSALWTRVIPVGEARTHLKISLNISLVIGI